MDLFELKDEELKIHPAAFALTPFRSLWVRKGRKKERATQELAYIYFMLDLRSDFRHVYPEREREKLIIQSVGLPPDFKPDDPTITIRGLYPFVTSLNFVRSN